MNVTRLFIITIFLTGCSQYLVGSEYPKQNKSIDALNGTLSEAFYAPETEQAAQMLATAAASRATVASGLTELTKTQVSSKEAQENTKTKRRPKMPRGGWALERQKKHDFSALNADENLALQETLPEIFPSATACDVGGAWMSSRDVAAKVAIDSAFAGPKQSTLQRPIALRCCVGPTHLAPATMYVADFTKYKPHEYVADPMEYKPHELVWKEKLCPAFLDDLSYEQLHALAKRYKVFAAPTATVYDEQGNFVGTIPVILSKNLARDVVILPEEA